MTEEQMKAFKEKIKNMSPEELQEFQKQQCIFCQIISGKVPSQKVYEDDKCLVILDINPAVKGHLLILPKEHYGIMPQVPEETLDHLFLVSKTISQVLLKSIRAQGTNIFIANGLAAGQKAQHFMIHLIPRKENDGILKLETKLIDKEMRTKVHNVVELKLNEMLGIKKGIQEKLPTEKKEEITEEVEPKETKKPTETKEESEYVEDDTEETTESKEPVGKKVTKKKVTKKKVTKKKKFEESEEKENSNEKEDDQDSDEKSETEEHHPTTKEVEEAVTLDDIANLFK